MNIIPEFNVRLVRRQACGCFAGLFQEECWRIGGILCNRDISFMKIYWSKVKRVRFP